MDAEGERRWRGALAPFDGLTLFISDEAALCDLRPMLAVVVEVLQTNFSNSNLFTLHDWHDHDGFGTEAKPTNWQELRSLLASGDALKRACTGEFAVRTAFFPKDYSFYLRIYVDDEALYSKDPQQVFEGDFDVTCREPLAARLVDALKQKGYSVQTEPAKAFFDWRYDR